MYYIYVRFFSLVNNLTEFNQANPDSTHTVHWHGIHLNKMAMKLFANWDEIITMCL